MFIDEATSAQRRRVRFLVVDDHSGSRGLVKTVLTQSGYSSVTTCEDGKLALMELRRNSFDIVICDWNMPRMSGIELLERVRSDDKLQEILFVMLTAQQQQNEVVLAYSYGVTDYVIKPFTPEVLLNKVQRLLTKHGLL